MLVYQRVPPFTRFVISSIKPNASQVICVNLLIVTDGSHLVQVGLAHWGWRFPEIGVPPNHGFVS